jgi:hypothetical protein
MDLPVTIPMLNHRKIKVLHLEPTDVCQAACPLCARETDIEFDKNFHHHLTMDQIFKVFAESEIADLDKMFMCGNYGDPAAGQHTIDIYKKFRDINPNITLGMNTNGALRNTAWWQELGTIFNQTRDYVVFSIDGLEDTNDIYRINVNWKQLINNVQTFISSGGSAHWDMLIYQHNEHQVEQCRKLAKDLGFTWFRAKVSKRPFTKGLTAPINWLAPTVSGTIKCHALQEQSMYIDARGIPYPCCWLGSNRNQIGIVIDDVASTWHTRTPNKVCQNTCSSRTKSTFAQQWKIEEQLC